MSPRQPKVWGESFLSVPPPVGGHEDSRPPQSSGGDGKSNVSPPTWGVNKTFFGLSPRLWGDIWMDWDIVWGDRTNVWGESISSAPPAGRTLGGQFFSGGTIFYSEGADEISCPPRAVGGNVHLWLTEQRESALDGLYIDFLGSQSLEPNNITQQ